MRLGKRDGSGLGTTMRLGKRDGLNTGSMGSTMRLGKRDMSSTMRLGKRDMVSTMRLGKRDMDSTMRYLERLEGWWGFRQAFLTNFRQRHQVDLSKPEIFQSQVKLCLIKPSHSKTVPSKLNWSLIDFNCLSC